MTLPPAANGTDLNACAEGNCEVLVSGPANLPIDPRFGLASLSVADITPAGVDFSAVAADGTSVNMSSQTPHQGGPSVIQNLSAAVIAYNGTAAVIKLSPVPG